MASRSGRSVDPTRDQSIENNLSIATMDLEELAAAVDPHGVFQGF